MQHTANYNLPQWEAGDPIKRSDFNTAMSAIDAAIAGGVRIAVGSYIGTGTFGESSPTTLSFDFEPKLVIIACGSYDFNAYNTVIMIRGCAYVPSMGVYGTSGNQHLKYFATVSWSGGTVSLYHTEQNHGPRIQLNMEGITYHYFAIG